MPDYDVRYLLSSDSGELEVIERGRVTASDPEDARTLAEAAGVARGIDHEKIEVELAAPDDDTTVVDVTRLD